jgi:hypothetical protein
MIDSQRPLSLSLVLVKPFIIWISSSLLSAITAKMYLENTRKTGIGIGIDQNSWYRYRYRYRPKKLVSPITTYSYASLRLKFQITTCERAYSLRVVWPAEEVADPCEIDPPVFWEAEIFFKCVLRIKEMLFQIQILKITWGHAPRSLTCACGTRLTPSAIAYYPGGGQRKWAFWQFCPPLKNP